MNKMQTQGGAGVNKIKKIFSCSLYFRMETALSNEVLQDIEQGTNYAENGIKEASDRNDTQ